MELIGKQIAIETILGQPPELHYPSWYAAQIEKLPPAPPEYLAEQAGILVTDSDTISRAKAIEICRAPHMRNADCSDFEMAIMMLPPAQPAPSQVAADIARIVENGKDMRVIEAAQPTPDQNGDLWITVPDIDKVTCIYVQESKSKFCRIFYEEQPERIIHCKDCEWWTKQECSPQGRCALSGMYPTGGWFCGNARKREVTT